MLFSRSKKKCGGLKVRHYSYHPKTKTQSSFKKIPNMDETLIQYGR
jgi:hypothetical protein